MNFVAALAYCLALPAVFTQPSDHHLAEPARAPTSILQALCLIHLPSLFFVPYREYDPHECDEALGDDDERLRAEPQLEVLRPRPGRF